MKIPKIIKENGREYKFIKKCNSTVYLYEETKYGYKRCFTAFDLGQRTPQVKDRELHIGYHKQPHSYYQFMFREENKNEH